MPEYLAPGVFVEETSFRAKSIEGVSTTTTGFIGAARFGPVALEPDIVTSLSDYERLYDPFSPGSELSWDGNAAPNFLWHAVRAFFNEGGKRLYVSRVFKPLTGEFEPFTADDELASAPMTATAYQDGHARIDPATLGGLRVRARHPGAAANLRVRFTLKGGANVLVGQVDPVSGATIPTLRSVNDLDLVWIRDRTSSPAAAETGLFAIAHWNEDQALWQFEPMAVTSPVETGDWFDVTALNPDQAPDQGDSVRVVTLGVSLLSRDGSREIATWAGLPLHPAHRSAGAADSVFARFATLPASSADARGLPLVIARDPAAVSDAFDVLTALFGADPTSLLVPGTEETRRGVTPADKLTLGVGSSFQLDGGNDGQRPEAGEYEGQADPRKGYSLGLKQFEDIEDISMVAAPGSTWNYAAFRENANAITGLLIGHAERMRYRVALLDSAEGQTIADVRGMRAKLDSKHAALYYPWVSVLDPVTHLRAQRHRARRLEGAGQRGGAPGAGFRDPAQQGPAGGAEPRGHQLLPLLRGPRLPPLGRTHHQQRPRVEVPQRAALLRLPRTQHRQGHAVGGVRTQRRRAVGQRAPHHRGLPAQRMAGRRAARRQAREGLLRALRPQHDDAERPRQRPPDLPHRRGAAEAGRVRDLPHRPMDGRPQGLSPCAMTPTPQSGAHDGRPA